MTISSLAAEVLPASPKASVPQTIQVQSPSLKPTLKEQLQALSAPAPGEMRTIDLLMDPDMLEVEEADRAEDSIMDA